MTSPEIADILLKLGAEKMVVGATRECSIPKASVVGSFGDVNLAKIVELAPTAVLATGLEQELLVFKLQKLQIPVYRFYACNLDQMLDNVLKVGQLCGEEDKAKEMVRAFRDSLGALDSLFMSHPRVYVEISTKPLISVSGSSFVGSLLTVAGGYNVFDSLSVDYPRVLQADVIKADPQVIICLVPGITKESIKNRLAWDEISAVQHGRIYTMQDVNPDELLRATPDCLHGIQRLRKLISGK